MLTKRRVKSTVYALWRGSFLRYSSLDEPDAVDYRDQWACQRVEMLGLDPTVKPGKTEYLRLCELHQQTLRKFLSMTDNNHRLFWTPPAQRPDPALAKILNALTGQHASEDDAALLMASHNEHCELVAEKQGLRLVRCNVPSDNMLACCERLGAITVENINRCLTTYSRCFPGELTTN